MTADVSLGQLLAQQPPQPPAVPRSGITSPEQFFDDFLAGLFKRDLSQHSIVHWCTHWSEHPEAVVVVGALWRSWEVLRVDEEMGMAIWMRDFAYPLMGRLFDESGTFTNCDMDVKEGHDHNAVTALNQPLI